MAAVPLEGASLCCPLLGDGDRLYTCALFDSGPRIEGPDRLQIIRIRQASGGAPEQESVFELPLSAALGDETRPSLRLLGALDGAVVFVQDEYDAAAEAPRRSSVLVIPKGQTGAQFVADFVEDDALFVGLVANADRLFWHNKSGRIFGLSRAVLSP